MPLFELFVVLIVFLYVILIRFYSVGFDKYPNYVPLNEKAANISATILIPCRNPSQQLQFLLKQLDHQLINGENTNVFVIDDFSDKEIVLDPSLKSSLLRLKQHRADLSNTKNNKKEAIALGVELSKHEYIICLDSDVTLSENWWYLVSNFIQDKKPKFAAGLHRYINSNSYLNKFLSLEQDILTASSIAALQLRIPTMCNGANMIFSKQAFYNVNGYDVLFHTKGGDDLFLYHRIYRQFPFDTHYIKNLDVTVYSEAPKTLSELLKQRSRWISKTNHYENKWINIQAGVILLSNIICILCICIPALLPLFLLKIAIDIYFIYSIKSFYLLNNKLNLQDYISFSMIYPFYVALIGFYALLNSTIKKKPTY